MKKSRKLRRPRKPKRLKRPRKLIEIFYVIFQHDDSNAMKNIKFMLIIFLACRIANDPTFSKAA